MNVVKLSDSYDFYKTIKFAGVVSNIKMMRCQKVIWVVWLLALLVEVGTVLDEFCILVGDVSLVFTLSAFIYFNCCRDTLSRL